jgi:hypothetical protein
MDKRLRAMGKLKPRPQLLRDVQEDARPEQGMLPAEDFYTRRRRWCRALSMSDAGSSAFHIGFLLLEHVNLKEFEDSGRFVARPGPGLLNVLSGKAATIGTSAVRAALRRLRAFGVIEVAHKGGEGPRDTAHYLFRSDWLIATESALGQKLQRWPDKRLNSNKMTDIRHLKATDIRHLKATDIRHGRRRKTDADSIEENPMTQTPDGARSREGGRFHNFSGRRGQPSSAKSRGRATDLLNDLLETVRDER